MFRNKLQAFVLATVTIAALLGGAHQALAETCNGKVTEVTVTRGNVVGFRHTAMSANNNSWWVTACNLDTDGAFCEIWHRTLVAGVLSGRDVTVKANVCRTTDATNPVVDYIKLRD